MPSPNLSALRPSPQPAVVGIRRSHLTYRFFRLSTVILILFSTVFARADSDTGEISDAEILSFVKNGWGWTEFTDTVILGKLDLEYTSGLPFRDYIKAVIVGVQVHQYYAQGQKEEVTRVLLTYGTKQTLKIAMKTVGLRGVAAIGGAAAWPVEWGIDRFRRAVIAKGYNTEKALYFATRPHYSSLQAILDLPDNEPLETDAAGGVSKQGGWLRPGVCSYNCVPSIPGMVDPQEAFSQFETEWLCRQSSARFEEDNDILREAFGQSLRPAAPVVTTDLADQTIVEGQSATFTVAVSGSGPFQYVWEKDGVAYSGPGYGPAFNASEAGQYRVTVYDANNLSARSRAATLTVLPPGAPVSLTAPAGGATVSGSVTVRASATSATKVEFWLNGERRFTDTSTPFTWAWITTLENNTSHQIIAKAYAGTTLLGSTPSRSVTVNNAAPSTCSDPNEPNNSSLTATPLTFGIATNGYICTATDVDWFSVEVTTPGVIAFDLSVPAGSDYDLELFGPNAAFLTGSYRDADLPERVAHNAMVTGTYWVRAYGYPVGNGSHNAGSPFTLTVSAVSGPVTILAQPQHRTVLAGATASFSVTAAGTPPLNYQWQRNNVDILSATNTTYDTPALTLSDGGAQLRVRVSNSFGFVFSDSATLTVKAQRNNAFTRAYYLGGTFILTLTDDIGRTYRLQRTINFTNWVTLSTNAGPGLLQFVDEGPLPPRAFYRAVSP